METRSPQYRLRGWSQVLAAGHPSPLLSWLLPHFTLSAHSIMTRGFFFFFCGSHDVQGEGFQE
jgi:hypothetical protein